MASLDRCPSCRGFVPNGASACPNCGVVEPASRLGDRVGLWLKAAGGGAVAMTLMACYGVPIDEPPGPDTDPTEGTGGATGDSAEATAAPTGGEASTSAAESTTSASGSTTGAAETGSGGTGGSDGTTGGAGVVDPPLPR